MKTHIEIIDGQEVLVKVYEPNATPKKLTVKTKGFYRKGRSARRKGISKAKNKNNKCCGVIGTPDRITENVLHTILNSEKD